MTDTVLPDTTAAARTAPVLEVRGLRTHFPVKRGFLGRTVGHVRAVDGVDLSVRPGETLGLVGESGCGKTTLGRSVARILRPTSGRISYRPEAGAEPVDVAALSGRGLRAYQRQVRVVFQDPFSSLNPRMTLLQIVGEPLRSYGIATGAELEDRVAAMLTRVGLSPKYLHRYPHAFSGGERQRVSIARALIVDPKLVVADEPVSALDVSVRAQILNLLRDLQEEFALTYLFISHDLSVVESVCDRVAVMYLGRIVELAGTDELYARPRHPYTEALLSAVPRPDPRLRGSARRIRLSDDLPDPAHPPAGCPFRTRCRFARPGLCDVPEKPPALIPAAGGTDPGHRVACHLAGELTLTGVHETPGATA
ncbi:peptide ABC transporter ATP-binding protein [Streptomyces sp. WAC 06738]|uniref:ABC transporter ATP-binding protein n=1 Tax=Streptomyces sp. WAC 06738 TaxID=2203210 RepID=UPI000F71AF66|nr:oligopeptide/dipeptide ABC transporter ATP-binding protein [Streptomyces sp. WAC 06738]AZM50453.1 peptide ABC transporter ATP-binding protein [Streptomyces sp. WAC 06738]